MTRALSTLPVLVLDCQTTGASPHKGHLIEVGWCVSRASSGRVSSDHVAHHLVQLPRGANIPRSVQRLTGLSPASMRDAVSRERIWTLLESASDGLRAGSAGEAPTVAHFARFERQFLSHLHRECSPDSPFFPMFLCTHEIARRLFPDLPRRGLHVLAGFLGFPFPEPKRAAAHVAATTGIWAQLVKILERDFGVRTMEDLCSFLSTPPPPRRGPWTVPLPREKRLGLSKESGVYRLMARGGSVLYVGKAGSLRARVNSYYRQRRAGDKVLELISQVHDIETTVTRTRLEAALLENEEIKRLEPPYNTALRSRGEGPWFFTPDLASVRTTPDNTHRVGPVAVKEPLEGLLTLSRVLSGSLRAEAVPSLIEELQLPRRSLKPAVVTAGVKLFRNRNETLDQGTQTGDLLSLGTRLRKRHLDQEQQATAETTDEIAELRLSPPESRSLSPTDIAESMESLIVSAARLYCRAKWLCLISESTLVWTPSDLEPDLRRVITLESGNILGISNLPPGRDPPLPPGEAKGHLERLRSLDGSGYDRLRVLTTEIRRVLHNGRDVVVILGTRRCLGPPQLSRVLRMA